MQIESDYELDNEFAGLRKASLDVGSVNACDQAIAERVNALSLHEVIQEGSNPLVETTMNGRVVTAQTDANEWIESALSQIDPEHFQEVEQAIVNGTEAEPNYINEINALIGKILVQLNRISQKNNLQINDMKIKYKDLTSRSAVLQRELAKHNLMFSFISLGVACFQMAEDPLDKHVAKMFADNICPNLGAMFGASIQSNQQKTNALSQLVLYEYQAKTQKGQSDSSSKQELTQTLQRVLDGLTQASRAG